MNRNRIPMIITSMILFFFYLPLIVVFINSFNSAKFGGAWMSFTLDWYVRLFTDRNIWHAITNTLIIAVTATLTSMVLGTSAAYALYRYKDRIQFSHRVLIITPLVVPDILMGISLLLLFVSLKIELGLLTIYIAHVTFCLSYVAMVVLGRLQDFDYSVMEAARDLGATAPQAVKKVLVPMLMPGIVSGGLLAFTLSIDDFVITFFVSGPGSSTLPVYLYSLMKHGSPTIINALSVVLISVTFLTVIISKKISEGKG